MFGPLSFELDPERDSMADDHSGLEAHIPTNLPAFATAPIFSCDLHGHGEDAISALSSEGPVQPSRTRSRQRGSKRNTKLFKKKQAYSILFKHVMEKWSIRIQKQYDLTLAQWRQQGISRGDFKIKLTKSVRKDVLGVLFFPELSKDFDQMRHRMDTIMNYADNFNLDYDRLLFHCYQTKDGKVKVDYSLLNELVSSIDSIEDILDGFLFRKINKHLSISPGKEAQGSLSKGSANNQQMQIYQGFSATSNTKQIPTKDELQDGFKLLKDQLINLHAYVQGLAASCPVRGSEQSKDGPSNKP